MKFFIAIALFAAVASARILPANVNLTPMELAEIEQIIAAIHSPSTDPTTAVMLEQMLFELLGIAAVQPPINIPALIDEYEPIHVGPAVVDFPIPDSALEPSPKPPKPEAPAAPTAPVAPNSPLVQIIVNVNQDGAPASPSPVQIDHVDPTPVAVVEKPKPTPVKPVKPTPVIVVDQAESEIKPTPVIVVDQAEESEVKPTPVIVVEDAFQPAPEPVIIGHLPEPVVIEPVIVAPAIVGPEILN